MIHDMASQTRASTHRRMMAPIEIHTPDEARHWQPPDGRIVLLVAYSRFGQGHVSRCLKVAHALRALTTLEPVVVCGNPEFLRSHPCLSFQTLSLPPYLYARGKAPTRSPDLADLASPLPSVAVEDLTRYRGRLLSLLVRQCRPAGVLIDHFPFSGDKSIESCGEAVARLRASDPPVPVFSGFRGVLSSRCANEKAAPQAIITALARVDRVFAFLDAEQRRGLFDRYPFLRDFEDRFEVVGHVGPGEVPSDPPEPGLVLATFGGGLDAFHRIDALCRALPLLQRGRHDLHLEVVTGRQLPEKQFERLVASHQGDSIRIRRHVDLLPRRFTAAELLICGAGYNTLVEARAMARDKVVSIPRSSSGISEQYLTASRFEQRGDIDRVLSTADLEPALLARRLASVMDQDPLPRSALDLRGAEQTARRLGEILAPARLG